MELSNSIFTYIYILNTHKTTQMEKETSLLELQNLVREVAQMQKDNAIREDQRSKELRKLMAITDEKFAKTDEQFAKTDEWIKKVQGSFDSKWGKLMESLVEGDIIKILKERGVNVRDTSMNRKGNYKGHNYEFDIIAHNGNEIVIIEVKTTLRVKHVKQHIDRLNQVKTWMPEYKNFKVYGAVAFLRSEEESDTFAKNENLFVIRATGDSAAVMNRDDFVPRIF